MQEHIMYIPCGNMQVYA